MLAITHANLISDRECLPDRTVLIDRPGRIVSIEKSADCASWLTDDSSVDVDIVEIIDADGLYLAPGLIDLQLNGGFGHDFTQRPETIWSVARQLPRLGVTGFCPTIITSPLSTVAHARAVLAAGPPAALPSDSTIGPTAGYAQPYGLHLEGPFLNPEKKGAHNQTYLRRPDPDLVAAWTAENGVRLVTLAPELPGALSVIDQLVLQGVVVSAGHTMATYKEAMIGFSAGITTVTHLFNAMRPLHHREPGIIGAALERKDISLGIIPDGIHVHPALLRLVDQIGTERVNLVTDGMGALGMPDGVYQLGEYAVIVAAGEARLPDRTLAGSVIEPLAALRNWIDLAGVGLPEALFAMSGKAADMIGLGRQKGRIAVGYDADLILFEPDLKLNKTIIGGEIVYSC